MCKICRHRTCLPACPNYRADAVATCGVCGDEICRGEPFYKLSGGTTVCQVCAEELSLYGFLQKCRAAGVHSVTDLFELTEEVIGV